MFREMSEIELIIQGIKNVQMISIYELTGIDDMSGKGCAAISVLYDREGQINLCELDDGFEILADRIFEIYGEAESKSQIFMDERTRSILECGWLNRDDGFLDIYYGLQAVGVPGVAFEAALSRRFFPIAEYVLEALYKMLGIKYEITVGKPGWRGSGVIYGIMGNQRVVSGLKIIQNTNEEYEITVNNFITSGNVLKIEVSIYNSCVILMFSSIFRDFHGTGRYELREDGYTESYEAFCDGKRIFRDSNSESAVSSFEMKDELKRLVPSATGFSHAVVLPWGMTVLIHKERKKKSNYTVDNFTSCFLFEAAMYSETRCWTRITNSDTKFSMKTSSVIMISMTLKNGDIQTYFVPHMGNHKSRYREQLGGRFYIIDRSRDGIIRE